MKTIDLPDDLYALAASLAERCEWTLEEVLRQALLDAEELQDDFEANGERELMRLIGEGADGQR